MIQTMVDQGFQAGSSHTHYLISPSPIDLYTPILLGDGTTTKHDIVHITGDFIFLLGLQDPVVTYGNDL
jgi:hypothetical protein